MLKHSGLSSIQLVLEIGTERVFNYTEGLRVK